MDSTCTQCQWVYTRFIPLLSRISWNSYNWKCKCDDWVFNLLPKKETWKVEETAFSILYMINIALIGGGKSPNQRRGLIVKLSICIILCVLLWPMMQVSRRFKSKVGMCDHFPLYYSTGTVWKIICNKRGHVAD